MEELLIGFIKNREDLDQVYILSWEVDGSSCFVEYSPHKDYGDIYSELLNIWDVLVYINPNLPNPVE